MISEGSSLSIFEVVEKLATIVIAAGTLFFSYVIYRYQLNKDSNDLKLDWYKVIIIESKFGEFFQFFSGLNEKLLVLNNRAGVTLEERQRVNTQIIDDFVKLENDFISLLLAVDSMLYTCVKHQFDDLVDGITIILGDDELDWQSGNIYDEEIANHVALQKTLILKLFVEFRGRKDSHLRGIHQVKDGLKE